MDENKRKGGIKPNVILTFLFSIVFICILCCCANVVWVAVKKIHFRSGTSLEPYIDSVAYVEDRLPASRGKIYDSNGVVVAQDVKTYDIICYVDESRTGIGGTTEYIDDISYASSVLAPILEVDYDYIYDILLNSKGLYQTELGAAGRNLTEEQKEAIEDIDDLHGIGFRESYVRTYPYGSIFAPQLIGFAQSDDTGRLVGKMGLEYYLNDELSGVEGVHAYQQSKQGYVLPGMYESWTESVQGYDVYLTIDTQIQEALHTAINKTIDKKEASRAWGSVVEIKTGKILAWDQYPSFDPNNIQSDDTQANFGAQLSYEPGSVMKPVIYSAAIDMGTYDPNDNFDSSPYCYTDGAVRTYSGDQYGCIHNVDYKNWGWIPLDYGLIYSSNVATATLLSQYVGLDEYEEYLHKYHFYEAVKTDGIDEVTGYTNYGLSPSDDITATYGQGSSVTMLQILQAYTAMMGNGEMLKPYFIDKIVEPETKNVLYQGSRTVVSRPISESAAKELQDILVKVVTDEQGTCRHYAAKTTQVMGKTGTSEIAIDGEYSEDDSIISVVLGFPYEDPQYLVYFAYVSPHTVYFNYEEKPVPDLVDKIVSLKLNSIGSDSADIGAYKKYEMPRLYSVNTEKAVSELTTMDLDVYVIGDGSLIIQQSPLPDDDVYTSQRVFLLTNGEQISIPDFTGWTRKDIIRYWSITNIPITIDGYGVVYEQSIPPGSLYENGMELILSLHDINYVEENDSVAVDSDYTDNSDNSSISEDEEYYEESDYSNEYYDEEDSG